MHGRMANARILIGAASWTDPSLVSCRKFYPPEVKSAEQRLRYYAERFPIVEVDSSYYALPSSRNASLWAERTPPQFVFNIKAFRLLTQHQTDPKVLPAEVSGALTVEPGRTVYYSDLPAEAQDEVWRQFLLALEPLRTAGKLGALLFQFPKWFVVGRSSYDHLRELRRRLEGYCVAIEFRHPSWFSERHRASTLAFEREARFCNVIVDEPQTTASSIPAVWEATTDRLAMLRMHGRNAQMWDKKGLKTSTERFDYDYFRDELRQFLVPVRNLAAQVSAVHVIFNNNKEDQGIRGARMLRELLENETAA